MDPLKQTHEHTNIFVSLTLYGLLAILSLLVASPLLETDSQLTYLYSIESHGLDGPTIREGVAAKLASAVELIPVESSILKNRIAHALIHAASALALLALLRRLRLPGAFAASSVFAIHPIATQLLFFDTYLPEVSFLFLLFLSLLILARKPSLMTNVLLVVVALAALLVHPAAFLLPLVFSLFVYFKEDRFEASALNQIAPAVATILIIGVWLQTSSNFDEGSFLTVSHLDQGAGLFKTLKQVFFSPNLQLFHAHHEGIGFAAGIGATLLAILLFLPFLIVAFLYRRHRSARAVLFSLSTYLLLTVFGIAVSSDFYGLPVGYEDRQQYLALPFLVSLLFCGLFALGKLSNGFKLFASMATTLVVLALAFLTYTYNTTLRSDFQIWSALDREWPESAVTKSNMVVANLRLPAEQRRLDALKMAELLEASLAVRPDEAKDRQLLAGFYAELGEERNAVREYKRLIREAPTLEVLREAEAIFDRYNLRYDLENVRERIAEMEQQQS